MDFATTMDALAWEFYNRFVKMLIDYGIVYLPLLVFLYQNWLDIDILGKDAMQSVVALTVKRMLISVITFFFLYYLAFLPTVPLSIVNNFRAINPIPAYDSTFNQNVTALGNQHLSHDIVIKLPLFWAAMEIFRHSITKGFLDALPTTAGDIRGAMATVIQNRSIKSPFVKNQYEHFYQKCYSPAAGKFQYLVKQGDIIKDEWFWKLWESDIDVEEYDWVGGSFYLENAGFYKPCTEGNKCYDSPLIPFGITAKFNGAEVNCDQLWNTNGGLRQTLLKAFNLEDDEDDEIRDYLQHSENAIDIETDKEMGNLLKNPINFLIGTLATVASWIVEGLLEVVTTVIVAFLPIGQAIVMSIFVILLPIVLLVSALRIDVFIGLLMFYFTVGFLTVIWAIAAFIDNNIMNILTHTGNGNDSTASLANEMLGRLSLVGALVGVASALLYYQMTKIWFQLMGTTGKNGMKEAGQAMDNTGEAGDKVGSQTRSKSIE
jgi:hypothetical protein